MPPTTLKCDPETLRPWQVLNLSNALIELLLAAPRRVI
jgi:hypothetical protein